MILMTALSGPSALCCLISKRQRKSETSIVWPPAAWAMIWQLDHTFSARLQRQLESLGESRLSSRHGFTSGVLFARDLIMHGGSHTADP